MLALIALVRATNSSMLRASPDGFTFDFAALDAKKDHTPDDHILTKLRVALDPPPGSAPAAATPSTPKAEAALPRGRPAGLPRSARDPLSQSARDAAVTRKDEASDDSSAAPKVVARPPAALHLEPAEARRLAEVLKRLESIQAWPSDVLWLSRNLRSRLLR